MKKQKNSDSEPVTRKEFREAIEEVQSHVDDSRQEAGNEFKKVQQEIRVEAVETRRHMKVYAESIIDRVLGAFKDAAGDLKERVTRIEEHLGLRRED